MIIQRGAAIGLDWPATLAELQKLDWESRMAQATDPLVDSYPDYYTQPFHAYKQVPVVCKWCDVPVCTSLALHLSAPRLLGCVLALRCCCRCVAGCLLQGNLCWDAALEFALSSQSVHAPVMDPENKVMDPQ